MRLRKALIIPALCSALLLGSLKQANADSNLHIGLFPEQPVYRTIMADPDILRTEIQVPQGLEKELLEKPVKKLLPYISLSKTLPLASLDISSRRLLSAIPKTAVEANTEPSDKILSALIVAGGQLNFPQNLGSEIDYKTKLELFLNSPMIDTCLSEGNRLYLIGGFNTQGSIETRGLENKSLSEIPENFNQENYSFSADAYIVPKSPYSDQFLIFRVGVDNLFSNISEKPNVNISTTWEFPPLFHFFKMFENFKLSPYTSLHIQIPTGSENEKPITAIGQLGIKASGESDRAVFLYTQANYNAQKPWSFYTGLKLDL